MHTKDPIQTIEGMIKNIHDHIGKYTQPVLYRYPLLFAFLIIFSVSMIMHGFNDLISEFEYFTLHPGVVMLIGILVLVFTGKLYQWLEKSSH